jgi:hypothetical protein
MFIPIAIVGQAPAKMIEISASFIMEMFINANKVQSRHIYRHYTTRTDSNIMKSIIDDVL